MNLAEIYSRTLPFSTGQTQSQKKTRIVIGYIIRHRRFLFFTRKRHVMVLSKGPGRLSFRVDVFLFSNTFISRSYIHKWIREFKGKYTSGKFVFKNQHDFEHAAVKLENQINQSLIMQCSSHLNESLESLSSGQMRYLYFDA